MKNRTARLWLLLAATSSPVVAQTPMPGDSVHASKTLFTYRDAGLAAGFVGLTFAMFPLDRSMARRLQDSSTQASHFFKNASTGVAWIANPGAIVIGVGMYGVGKIAGWKDVTDLGFHGLEAVLLASATTELLKGVAGRARPYQTGDTSAHDFKFGRGFGNAAYQSFPSGHSTAAFAAAATVTSESQRWWPHETWIVAPIMYGGATMVGLSRMYQNQHWASDVALGAAIGTFAGIKVERYSHGHSNNFLDRFFLGMQAGPSPDGGAQVGFSFKQ